MPSRDDDTYIIWPLYFDKTLTRKQGRKVAKKFAVDKPQIDVLMKAAQSLGLHPILEKSASHPSRPFLKEGRLLVNKKTSKIEMLKQIANRL